MGCSSSSAKKAEPAPYMHAYFELLKEHVSSDVHKQMEDPMSLIELAMDPEAMATHGKEQEEKSAELKKKLTSLIEKSFDHHDKSGNGVLSVEDSSLFFDHFVDEKLKFDVVLSELMAMESVMKVLKVVEQMMGQLSARDKKEAKRQAEAQVKTALEGVKQKAAEQNDEYKRNKADRDKAAFKILDVSGDGKLQREEVIPAFMPQDPKQAEFMSAFGFEVMTQAELQFIAQGGFNEGCPMQ